MSPTKYFFSRTVFHHSEFPVINLHKNFEPSTKLQIYGSLMPNPPFTLGFLTSVPINKMELFSVILSPFPEKAPQVSGDGFFNTLRGKKGTELKDRKSRKNIF
jgi:hypothetical protein